MKTTMLIAALALGGVALNTSAQDNPAERPPRRELGGPGVPGPQGPDHPGLPPGPGGPGRRPPPPPPLFAALDANHDGVIDEQEIANAPAALRTLDKNGDGKLTLDELRPPRPEGMMRGPGGFDGDRPPPFRGPPPQGRPEGNFGEGQPPRPQRPPPDQ